MNNEYKKKYLKYKKKYLQFKQLRGGAAGAEVDLRLEIDLAGGLFFALSSSLFLDKFYDPRMNYTLDIELIINYFNVELGKMKAWHTRTGGEGVAPKETEEDFSGFPWNNKQTMIDIFREKISELSHAKIIELLIQECNEIGDLDTKLHAKLSDEDIKEHLNEQDFPSYAAMFFLAREKCGDFNIAEILAFLKKKGEKTDLGASVLDRTFLSKLIHSNKNVLEKICWELIFIILKNEPGKIEKRMRRFIIFYFIFNNPDLEKLGFPQMKHYYQRTDFLLNLCTNAPTSQETWDTKWANLCKKLPKYAGESPPALLSATTLGTKINAQVGAINTTVENLVTFNKETINEKGSWNGWASWETLKTQYFPRIFPEIFDSSSEGFIKQKLDTAGKGEWVAFAIEGFRIIKQLIKDQTTLNSLLLTSFDGFGGNGLPYQNLAQNIKFILDKMNTFLQVGGATVPTVPLDIHNFTEKASYIEIAKAIKNIIVNLATDSEMAELSDNMKDFYIKSFNLKLHIEGPSGFSWARVQVPMNLGNISPELIEKIKLLRLSINKLTIKNPSRQNITETEVAKVLTELGYGIPDMSQKQVVQNLATLKSAIIEENEQEASKILISFLPISETQVAQILAGFQTEMVRIWASDEEYTDENFPTFMGEIFQATRPSIVPNFEVMDEPVPGKPDRDRDREEDRYDRYKVRYGDRDRENE